MQSMCHCLKDFSSSNETLIGRCTRKEVNEYIRCRFEPDADSKIPTKTVSWPFLWRNLHVFCLFVQFQKKNRWFQMFLTPDPWRRWTQFDLRIFFNWVGPTTNLLYFPCFCLFNSSQKRNFIKHPSDHLLAFFSESQESSGFFVFWRKSIHFGTTQFVGSLSFFRWDGLVWKALKYLYISIYLHTHTKFIETTSFNQFNGQCWSISSDPNSAPGEICC